MYKSKWMAWICIFIIYIVSSLVAIIPGRNNKITAFIDADSVVMKKVGGKVDITDIKDNAQMIISSNPDLNEPGFERLSGSIYSPVVCYYPGTFYPNSMLYKMGTATRYINMETIINTVINDTKIKDMNFDVKKDYDKGEDTIKVFFPSKGSAIYDASVEQIYLVLNNMRVPTDEEREELRPTVEEFLSKTEECNDAASYINGNNIDGMYLFIGGEYVLNNSCFNSEYSSNYFPAYFEKSKVVEYYVFVRPEYKENVEKLLGSKKFARETYLRTSYYNKYQDVFTSRKSPNGINIIR